MPGILKIIMGPKINDKYIQEAARKDQRTKLQAKFFFKSARGMKISIDTQKIPIIPIETARNVPAP